MDKYHIYEEIGKGEFSQVFKGREKKKIEYVAIKRIEKSVMQKIVSEVQIMHKLNSAHILRFYDWYETRNNLWLILEYCTGGDLECILKQDGHLPETSVKIFGLDIVAGVKYLHSQGLIHTDLRPKNFLVDEYGILKLADFKLVQKIPTKLLSESQLPLEARGCPPYMAPEIITGEGIHSYQSDFWSIGCILYELRRGIAPFGDQESSIGDLIAKIRNIEPVSSPILFKGKDADKRNAAIPPISAELADLIQWLLEKAPMNRCTWVELSDHPFWGNNKPAPPTSLPPQHVFDALVRDQEKHRTQQMELDTNREYGVLPCGPGQQQYSSSSSHYDNKTSTPLKLPVSESTPIRPAPVSRMAPSALAQQHHQQQPEVEVPVVISPSKQADEKILTRQDVRALNMESSAKILGNIESKWNDDKSNNQESKRTVGLTRVPSEERIINLSIVEEKSVIIEQPPAQKRPAAAIAAAAPSTPSAAPQSKDSAAGSPRPSTAGRDERKWDLEDNDDKSTAMGRSSPFKKAKAINRSKPNDELGLIRLLVHPSDTQVKPIVGNKAIEVIEKPGFNDEALPFDVISLEELLKLNSNDVEYHLTQVHKCLSKSIPVAQSTTPTPAILTALQERVNALGYLCAIASAPEISNVILNTPFLATILKLMKAIPQYNSANAITAQAKANTLAAGTRGSTLSNGIATLTANVVTVATASRTLAATALAILLRFSTYIQPPTIRLREEHIIPSVVALLKEAQRMDPKFKRRAVAALGETIFYITAQEEESASQEGAAGLEKWVIPNSAIDMLSRCLRDDTDETIRHYAAKTIENVFAQGGLEYRRRFSTFDIAVRLLELSQSSKSEALQASCGMALAHMFLFIMTPNNLPPLSTTGGFNGELSTTITKKTGLNATIAPPNIPDPFVYPIPVSGAKFIAKVLEKGGLSGIIETLKDGQPKLQQAYLSILNVIFCAPINLDDYCNRSVDEFSAAGRKKTPGKETGAKPSDANGIMQAVSVSLRLTRQYFIKSALMIPLVIKLIDQGATSAIRGKAFLAAHLLCKQTPASLATLGERRLPQILVKLLEPILSQITAEGPGGPPIELSYVAKTAICMVNYIRDVSEEASQTIVDLLSTLIQAPSVEIRDDASSQAGQSSLKTPEPSPDKMSMRNRKTPQSAAPLKNTPGAASTNANAVKFDVSKLRSATEMLLSAISIASQPGLRKLILALDGQFVFNLSEALKRLPSVHAALAVQGTVHIELQDALESVEQACLISLETLSQVDLLDDGSSAGPPSLSSVRNNLSPAPKSSRLLAGDEGGKVSTYDSLLSEEGWEFFIESYVLNLVPSVCLLMNHHSGNVRAIVASSLRRVVPSAVRMCLLRANQDIDSPLNQEVAIACINQYVSRVSTLLSDSAPIPQYAVRVLSDVALISKGVTLTVVNELRRYEVTGTLINMLREAQDAEEGGEVDEETPITVDPQLISLFRTLLEYNEGAVLLLENDLGSALCHALLRMMYAHLDLANENITESIQMLIDLLYITLQFVLQSLARANNDAEPIGPKAMPKAEKQYNAEQNRRMAAPLRAVIPALLLVFVKVDQYYEAHGHRRHEDPRGGGGGGAEDFRALCGVLNHLVDCSSVCLALLFDLFQEAATNQLLSKQSVMVDTEVTTVTIAGYEDIVSPRMVLAKLLGNTLMESKVKARILKIIHAVCKLVINSNAKPRAQEYLCQEPLFPTLQKIFKTYNSREALGNAAENAAFAKLVLQILDFANSM